MFSHGSKIVKLDITRKNSTILQHSHSFKVPDYFLFFSKEEKQVKSQLKCKLKDALGKIYNNKKRKEKKCFWPQCWNQNTLSANQQEGACLFTIAEISERFWVLVCFDAFKYNHCLAKSAPLIKKTWTFKYNLYIFKYCMFCIYWCIAICSILSFLLIRFLWNKTLFKSASFSQETSGKRWWSKI